MVVGGFECGVEWNGVVWCLAGLCVGWLGVVVSVVGLWLVVGWLGGWG